MSKITENVETLLDWDGFSVQDTIDDLEQIKKDYQDKYENLYLSYSYADNGYRITLQGTREPNEKELAIQNMIKKEAELRKAQLELKEFEEYKRLKAKFE